MRNLILSNSTYSFAPSFNTQKILSVLQHLLRYQQKKNYEVKFNIFLAISFVLNKHISLRVINQNTVIKSYLN